MTERDPLDDAFAVLRDETAESTKNAADRAAATRRALLVAVSTQRRRLAVVRLALPLAAVLAATAAWAAASGRLSAVFGSKSRDVVVHASEQAPPPSSSPAELDTDLTRREEDAGEAVATIVAPVELPPPSPEPTPLPPKTASQAPAPKERPSPEQDAARVLDKEEALYHPAHEAHFVLRDWSKALAAWDAYLAAYPTGRFAPEARYNRALVLLRLGRRDEARSALQPFADGTFGGYRQREAKELVEALE
jgi:tetratricopeptide (TPR) repeat protein